MNTFPRITTLDLNRSCFERCDVDNLECKNYIRLISMDGWLLFKGHRNRFPKLVKMLVLYIKINFNHRYIWFFPRNKVTVVLKLALLASHGWNFNQEYSENFGMWRHLCQNKDPKTLHVALFNLCYVFHIVFIKYYKMSYWVAYNCAKKYISKHND